MSFVISAVVLASLWSRGAEGADFDLLSGHFYRVRLDSDSDKTCTNGADRSVMGILTFIPRDKKEKWDLTSYKLPVNCKGAIFKRSAVICSDPTSRTLHVGSVGPGKFKATLEGESNAVSPASSKKSMVQRHPFLDDVLKTDFKSLNRAPDAIFVLDLSDTPLLTKSELNYMQVEIVVEDYDYGTSDEKIIRQMPVAKLQVSTECPGVDREYDVSVDSQIHLTFRSQGRVALSYVTKPKLERRPWYIGIWLYQRITEKEMKATPDIGMLEPTMKDVRIYMHKRNVSFMTQLIPILALIGIAVVAGILVLLYFHFFLQERFHMNFRVCSIWFQLMFIYFLRGRKPYAQMTVFLAVMFGVGLIQTTLHIFNESVLLGDRDVCQYNERCHSVFYHLYDVSWNSLISNIVYVIHGLFIILSFSLKEAHCYKLKHFYYYDYSVCYALGWSLCFVGLFSAFYHICPGRVVFQMDTTFMFTMSILIFVAVIHGKSTRPEDMLLASHSVKQEPRKRSSIFAGEVFLFFLAPLVVFNFVGSIKDEKPPNQGQYHSKKDEKESYGLSLSSTIVYSILVFVWLFGVLIAGAFKTGLWGIRIREEAPEVSEEPVDGADADPGGVNANQSAAEENCNANAGVEAAASEDCERELTEEAFKELFGDGEDANRDWNAYNELKRKSSIYIRRKDLSKKSLGVLRGIYISLCIIIVAYFLKTFITASDLSGLYLNFCFIIAGAALAIGEVFHYREFEGRRKDRTKKKFLAAIIIYYLIIAAVATVAMYFFTAKQVYLSGADVADSRDVNKDCIFLNYYDYHSMWHVFGSFMLLQAGLRVGQLSEPCRLCALKLVGEVSKTPSIALETSLHGINPAGRPCGVGNAEGMQEQYDRIEREQEGVAEGERTPRSGQERGGARKIKFGKRKEARRESDDDSDDYGVDVEENCVLQ